MAFSELFRSFSRRNSTAELPAKKLTPAFRNRVLMRCRDVFGGGGYFDAFWSQIHTKLTYLHGSPGLSPAGTMGRATNAEDCLTFLTSCSDQHFLDFIEFVFAVPVALHVPERDELVDDFNEFLAFDDLPYAVTPFVWTKGTTTLHGQSYESMSITQYPQVIRKDSQLAFARAVEPALSL